MFKNKMIFKKEFIKEGQEFLFLALQNVYMVSKCEKYKIYKG